MAGNAPPVGTFHLIKAGWAGSSENWLSGYLGKLLILLVSARGLELWTC